MWVGPCGSQITETFHVLLVTVLILILKSLEWLQESSNWYPRSGSLCGGITHADVRNKESLISKPCIEGGSGKGGLDFDRRCEYICWALEAVYPKIHWFMLGTGKHFLFIILLNYFNISADWYHDPYFMGTECETYTGGNAYKRHAMESTVKHRAHCFQGVLFLVH